MEVQIIRASTGEELVVIARTDYEALVRRAALAPADAEDAVLARHALAAVDAGLDGAVPESVWEQLERPGSRLRVLRQWRGMTQEELAHRAGVSQVSISNSERAGAPGARHGAALAKALRVPLQVLLGDS